MIFYSNHHVMPFEIVFAEIYASYIRYGVIYKYELLMIPLGKPLHEWAGTVCIFHLNLVVNEGIDHLKGLIPFMA